MTLTLKKTFLNEKPEKIIKQKKLKLKNLFLQESQSNGTIQIDPKLLKQSSDLERELENEINKSVDLEESSNDNLTPGGTLEEKMSAGGFEYETVVINALRQAKASGNISKGAGASAAAADADMNIFGNIFDVEVKLNRNAQMGGSSVRYSKNNVELVNKLEDSTEEILKSVVLDNKKTIDDLLNFLVSQSPKEYNAKAKKFPISVTKDTWEKASKAGKLFNAKVSMDSTFIENHYAKKKIYYIQIGGAGLFYLSRNPAKLPIPKLNGKVDVELRTARSGSKKIASGLRIVAGGIRVQGRLKTKNKSPYTLDDPESIKAMFAHIQNNMKTSKPKDKKTSVTKSRPKKIGH